MLVTTRDTAGRRRSKTYASNATARSSKTSLLSVFTAGSAGSGDSNTTVTQNSYDRSQHRRRRRTKDRRQRVDESPVEHRNKSIDVFDFLVEKGASKESLSLGGHITEEIVNDIDEENPEHDYEDLDEQEECDQYEGVEDQNEDDDCERSNEPDAHIELTTEHHDDVEEGDTDDEGAASDNDSDEEALTPEIVVHTEDADPEVYYRNMSDSGISMGTCSIDASLASLPTRHSILHDEPPSRPSSRQPTGHELAVIDPRWTWSASPGPFHDGYIPPHAPVPPPIMYEVPPYPPYPPYTPYGTPPPQPEEIRGPAIKIREPSQQDVKPKCFRSFTKVSTRVLLQLQDDIAELEGELSVLDVELDLFEADSGSDDEAPLRPGPPRHILKARESEIYDELQFKLGQYASTLDSMHKMERMSQPATKSDLTKHHRWLEARITPAFRARHLVGNDLRTFLAAHSPDAAEVASHDTQFLAYIAMINTLIPLLVFKLVNSVLTRLILLIIIVISGAKVHDRTRIKVRAEDMNCILMCLGISVFAALVL